ncbi:MAG: nucleotidyltransferase domain-containing protein [Candidatus Nanohalobium sp.]
MTLATEKDIEDFSSEVKEQLGSNLEELILFGSYATDEYVPGSDIDIAVIVRDTEKVDEEVLWDTVEDYRIERGLRFSPKVFEKEEFRRKLGEGYSFYEEVDAQGVRL